jgi:hypothetical protein
VRAPGSSSSPASASAFDTRWSVAALAALVFVLYGGALGAEFVLDGEKIVRDNALLSPFEPLRILTLDWWEGAGRADGLYRPVSLLVLAALRAIGGNSPALINLVNVALLALVAWLRFELLRRLLGGRAGALGAAWLASALALAHPLNAEIVCGQVGISDLLASVGMCSAVLLASAAPRASHFVLAGLCAALAALSKESGVLVVPLAVLFEALRENPPTPRARRVALAFVWSSLGVALALACRYAAIGALADVDDPVYAGFSTAARVASSCAVFAQVTLTNLVAPWKQLAIVGPQDAPPAASLVDVRALFGLAAVLILALAPLLALRRGRRDLAFGLWFFACAWLPTSNLLVSTGALAAARFSFAGSFALALPVALLLAHTWRRAGPARATSATLTCALLGGLALLTHREVAAWNSSRTLRELQVARAPQSSIALLDLGLELGENEPAVASALFTRAVNAPLVFIPGTQTPPEDLLEALLLAHLGNARIAEEAGRSADAVAHLRAAEQAAERGRAARESLPFVENWGAQRLGALHKLAALELARVRELSGPARGAALDAIERDLDACDALAPGSPETVRLRSLLFDRRGDSAGRTRVIEQAWRAQPGDPLLRILWANELRQSQRVAEALELELAVALELFESFDPARGLALARESVLRAEPRLAGRGRELLERLARIVPRTPQQRAVALEAAAALRDLSPAPANAR